jgi:hypothetical protein
MRHRLGLALTGVVLLCAGVAALAGGLGAFGRDVRFTAMIDGSAPRLAIDTPWFWPAVAAGGGVLALIGLIGLIAQLRTTLSRRVSLGRIAPRMAVRVATTGLVEEIGRRPGVRGVRAKMTGTRLRPRLVVTVTCDPHTDLSMLHEEIADGLVPRSRLALGRSELHTVVRFRVADAADRAGGLRRWAHDLAHRRRRPARRSHQPPARPAP